VYQYDIAVATRRTVIPQENEIIVPYPVRYGMIAAASVTALANAVTLGLVVKWRGEKVFRFSQPLFLAILCICGVIACLGTMTLGYFDITDVVCQLQVLTLLIIIKWCIKLTPSNISCLIS
jgi:hypothetical protein